jgi:hypothetical protein
MIKHPPSTQRPVKPTLLKRIASLWLRLKQTIKAEKKAREGVS